MKRSCRSSARRGTYNEPGTSAWILMLIGWLSVLPLCAFVFRPIQNTAAEAEPVFAQAALSADTMLPSTEMTMEIIPPVQSLRSDGPTILIYHTHTTEAYTQTDTDTYKETAKWRTSDNENNVVAVGEVLKEILETDYGFHVIHDTTDHEPPKLATSYERSLVTMQKYHEMYPSIVLFIDLHRDAHDTANAPCDYLTINGIDTARLMLVVGSGEKYDDKPYYASNVSFAQRITSYLNSIDAKLCRPIRQKTGRYNQHVAPYCILVEVGHNANTLSQAKAAMPYLAESIAYAFRSGSVAQSDWTPN